MAYEKWQNTYIVRTSPSQKKLLVSDHS